MEETPVLISRDPRGIVTATLNRPRFGNAYNGALLEALIEGLRALAPDCSAPLPGFEACASESHYHVVGALLDAAGALEAGAAAAAVGGAA
jgi:hypothetical protein